MSSRIFMLGNGPSLLQSDLTLLKGEHTFVCNGFYLLDVPFTPTYYAINSNKRHLIEPISERYPEVQKFLVKKVPPSYEIPTGWQHWPGKFELNIARDGFLFDDGYIRMGRSSPLTFTQIAWALGYREFYFLGCDETRYGHAYGLTGPLAERRKDGGLGALLTEAEWEENESTTKACYQRARTEIEEQGGIIKDCTPKGMLGVSGILPACSLEEVIG